MTRQPKTASELEMIVADLVGFDREVIMVEKRGPDGDFVATVTGRTAWLSKASAQGEVDKICVKIRTTYRLSSSIR